MTTITNPRSRSTEIMRVERPATVSGVVVVEMAGAAELISSHSRSAADRQNVSFFALCFTPGSENRQEQLVSLSGSCGQRKRPVFRCNRLGFDSEIGRLPRQPGRTLEIPTPDAGLKRLVRFRSNGWSIAVQGR